MSQNQTVRGVATSIYQRDGMTRIKYHDTEVVSFDDHKIILDSGGWRTNTTKTRMTQTFNQFQLNIGVYQEKGNWFVDRFNRQTSEWANLKIPFEDGVVIERKEDK